MCGSLEANCYIVYRRDGGAAYIIDPGYDVAQTEEFVKTHGLNVGAVLLTHTHHDHAGKSAALADIFGVDVCAGREETDHYNGRVDRAFDGGETLELDGETIHVLNSPGHSAGGVCYFAEKARKVFTGDTIFDIDTGYTHFPGSSANRMKDTMKNVVDKWENDVCIYPGHGDSANMKRVREINQEFLDYISG